ALSIAFTTTAIMPVSDFTMPFSAIWSIARHRLPVLQPEPTALKFTTGLMNGSLRPAAVVGRTVSFLSFSLVFESASATVVPVLAALLVSATAFVCLLPFAAPFGVAAFAKGSRAFVAPTGATTAFTGAVAGLASPLAGLEATFAGAFVFEVDDCP